MRTHHGLQSHARLVGSALLMAALLPVQLAGAQPSSEPASVGTAAIAVQEPALFKEPRILRKGISWIEGFGNDETGQPKDGFYAELGHMITGAGWISAGPGYRRHLWGDRALMDVSAAVSWRAYKIAQGRFEFPSLVDHRVAIGTKVLWQDFTQVRYYGLGPESSEAAATDYRLQTSNLVAYATWRPHWKLGVTGAVGLMSRPGLSSSTGPFDRNEPDTLQVFAGDPAANLTRQPRFLHGDLSVTSDTRDHASYPTRGGLYRAAWASYRDRADGNLTFDRWEVEAAQFIPVARDRGVLAVRWWAVLSDTGEGREIPFYLLPSLGGHNTLRGYADYRFHDRHLMVVNAESRWALFPHLDGAVFFDAGNVAAPARDLDVARTSYGFGFRLHTGQTTLGRFDVARSTEGWRFLLKLSDSLRLARLSRRTAAVPFVP